MNDEQDKLPWAQELARKIGKWVTPAAPFQNDPRANNHRSEGWLIWDLGPSDEIEMCLLNSASLWSNTDEWFPTLDAVLAGLRKLHDQYLDEEESKYNLQK